MFLVVLWFLPYKYKYFIHVYVSLDTFKFYHSYQSFYESKEFFPPSFSDLCLTALKAQLVLSCYRKTLQRGNMKNYCNFSCLCSRSSKYITFLYSSVCL